MKRLALMAAVTICWFGMSSSFPGRASCVAPELQLGDGFRATGQRELPVAEPGTRVEIKGRHFFKGCDDVGGGSMFGCSQESKEQRPYRDMVVEIRGPVTQETRRMLKRAALSDVVFETSVELATIDADDDFTFDEQVRLPDLARGKYFLVVGPLYERVRISE